MHQGGLESLPWCPVNRDIALEYPMEDFDEAGAPPNNLQIAFSSPAQNPTCLMPSIAWNHHVYMSGWLFDRNRHELFFNVSKLAAKLQRVFQISSFDVHYEGYKKMKLGSCQLPWLPAYNESNLSKQQEALFLLLSFHFCFFFFGAWIWSFL